MPASSVSNEALWTPVRDELDRWSGASKTLRLWWRDDDATEPTVQLDRLAELSTRFAAPVLLAVIPMLATPALARRIADVDLIRPCQHGFTHANHATPTRKGEFGPQRTFDVMIAELRAGQTRLAELCGRSALPVFVPPWNRIEPALAAELPALGFKGLSTIRTMPARPVAGLSIVDADLDVIDWRGGRIGRAHGALIPETILLLQAKRAAADASPTLGVITHHLVHDETAWSFMHALFALMRSHPAVTFSDPKDLFCAAES